MTCYYFFIFRHFYKYIPDKIHRFYQHSHAGVMSTKASQIVIVGAGIAGLACASRLKELGFTNVTILEAKNRAGGRINTWYSEGRHYELGAQYIHGEEKNPVLEIFKNHCSLKIDECFQSSDVPISHNFEISPDLVPYATEVCELLADADDEMCAMTADIARLHRDKNYPNSAGEYLLKSINEYLETETDERISNVIKGVFDWHMRLVIESNASDPVDALSALCYGQYVEFAGMAYTEVKNGYDEIIKHLVGDLGDVQMHLNSPVTEINWRNKVINVKTEEKTFEADYVVLTVPLGVLKESHVALFKPALPERKISAINCLGFGVINKIFLEFDEPFWPGSNSDGKDFNGFNYKVLWLDGLNYQGRRHEDGYAMRLPEDEIRRNWFRYIVRFACILGNDRTLCAWIVGDGAKYSETLSDDEVIGKCRELLIRCSGKETIPKARILTRSRWCSDEFTRGSYSFLSTDCDSDLIGHKHLSEPVLRVEDGVETPVLLFAGEATHDTMFSTTHGALLSGYREADRLSELCVDS